MNASICMPAGIRAGTANLTRFHVRPASLVARIIAEPPLEPSFPNCCATASVPDT